jgi:hypothetical protein
MTVLQVQLVQLSHQGEVFVRDGTRRLVVHARTRQRQQSALACDQQGRGLAFDPLETLGAGHLPSTLDIRSRSTVSCPILASSTSRSTVSVLAGAGGKDLGGLINQLPAPLGNLVRMDLVLGSDLVHGLLALQGLHRHLGLELGRMVTTGLAHVFPLLSFGLL